jgi:hypothetical protein
MVNESLQLALVMLILFFLEDGVPAAATRDILTTTATKRGTKMTTRDQLYLFEYSTSGSSGEVLRGNAWSRP